jgi:hypothetical protein
VLGVHCGIRKNNGYLSGNCTDDHLYYCHDINVKAYLKGICSWCAEGSKPGIDYCAIGWLYFDYKFLFIELMLIFYKINFWIEFVFYSQTV